MEMLSESFEIYDSAAQRTDGGMVVDPSLHQICGAG